MENELFGHEKGAFTGAIASTRGKVEAAEGGTLFIDEIGELPLPLQGKLLRVLQDREFTRVGGTETIRCNVRVIFATHRDLGKMVEAGEFREDLYYRIQGVPIHLKPLRERDTEDRVRLIQHFLSVFVKKYKRPGLRLDAGAFRKLMDHRFPGNVRELENCLQAAVVLSHGPAIVAEEISLPLSKSDWANRNVEQGPRLGDPACSLKSIVNCHIHKVLAACEGNQSLAAKKLKIGRTTLLRHLAEE